MHVGTKKDQRASYGKKQTIFINSKHKISDSK